MVMFNHYYFSSLRIPIMSKFFIQSAGIEIPVNDIDDCVVQVTTWRINNWGYVTGNGRNSPYRNKCLHCIIAERMGLNLTNDIDHIDLDKFNNRRLNLREATRSQNQINHRIHSNNTTGFKGVSFRRNKYRAMIMADGKSIELGYFDIPEEAHEAYCKAAIKYHKEFARFE